MRYVAAVLLLVIVDSERAGPFVRAPELLTKEECASLVAAALEEGLRPSLSKERVLNPAPLLSLLAALSRGSGSLDVNGNGVIESSEAAGAVRAVLNAPLFSTSDASMWLTSIAGAPNISVAWLAMPAHSAHFAARTRRVFERLLHVRPEKFSRFSKQVPLDWSKLENSREATSNVAAKLASFAESSVLQSRSNVAIDAERMLQVEPMQVIRYTRGGHYAPHSDSGWPGHRTVSLLVYLSVPQLGGETCFFPDGQGAGIEAIKGISLASYFAQCAQLMVAAGATCVSPAQGDVLAWQNTWQLGGALEVPRAHVACPVTQGEKWVASAWLSAPCDPGSICQLGR